MKKLLILVAMFSLFACKASAVGRTTYRNALVYVYSKANSVYEDDNIKLEIYDQALWATNKTKKTLFFNLDQCFLTHNGSSFPMGSKKRNERYASIKGYTTSEDQFITIAPSTGNDQNPTFVCDMSTLIVGEYFSEGNPFDNFTDYDKRLFSVVGKLTEESQRNTVSSGKWVGLVGFKSSQKYMGTTKLHMSEDESINTIGASIAYASSKKAENWNSVVLSTWVSDVIFAPYYMEMPKKIKPGDRKGFNIKEVNPTIIHIKADSPFEFISDKNPIVVCDWVGDFYKGSFMLKNPRPKMEYSRKESLGYKKRTIKYVGYCKCGINFDGSQANWGKMAYGRTLKSVQKK